MAGSKNKQGGAFLLKQVRTALGLTQSEFAALIGSSEGVVSKRERGIHEPSLKALEILRVDEALQEKGLRWSSFADTIKQQDA